MIILVGTCMLTLQNHGNFILQDLGMASTPLSDESEGMLDPVCLCNQICKTLHTHPNFRNLQLNKENILP